MAPIMEESLEKLWYLRREVDRVFREYFFSRQARPGETFVDVPVDMYETEQEIVIKAELSGCDKENVAVDVQADMLIIKGTKEGEDTPEGNLLTAERSEGDFRRIIELSRAADTQMANAKLVNGVLTIKVPKIPERRGQRRKIKVE